MKFNINTENLFLYLSSNNSGMNYNSTNKNEESSFPIQFNTYIPYFEIKKQDDNVYFTDVFKYKFNTQNTNLYYYLVDMKSYDSCVHVQRIYGDIMFNRFEEETSIGNSIVKHYIHDIHLNNNDFKLYKTIEKYNEICTTLCSSMLDNEKYNTMYKISKEYFNNKTLRYIFAKSHDPCYNLPDEAELCERIKTEISKDYVLETKARHIEKEIDFDMNEYRYIKRFVGYPNEKINIQFIVFYNDVPPHDNKEFDYGPNSYVEQQSFYTLYNNIALKPKQHAYIKNIYKQHKEKIKELINTYNDEYKKYVESIINTKPDVLKDIVNRILDNAKLFRNNLTNDWNDKIISDFVQKHKKIIVPHIDNMISEANQLQNIFIVDMQKYVTEYNLFAKLHNDKFVSNYKTLHSEFVKTVRELISLFNE